MGVLWAAYVLFCGITAMFGWGVALIHTLSSLYIGYDAFIPGAIIGALLTASLTDTSPVLSLPGFTTSWQSKEK
jgi:hypothetical protein